MNWLCVKKLPGVFVFPFFFTLMFLSDVLLLLNTMLLLIEKPFLFHLFKTIECLDLFLAEAQLLCFCTGLNALR